VVKAPAPAPALAPAARAKPAAKRGTRGARAKSNASKGRVRAALPASVTMAVERAVRGETMPAGLAIAGSAWGVLYRFVVRDANGLAILPGSFKIRKHLLPLASDGCFARSESGAHITEVELDAGARALDFIEASGLDPGAAEGREEVFEYFSFESQGVSYAIPQSGFVLSRSRRGRSVTLERRPQAGGSIHGAVVAGLAEGAAVDAYSFDLS
jgi:hypothetical protein